MSSKDPRKWYFCTWGDGCKVRRGTPQAIRVHRRDDHGEAWTKVERREQEKVARLAKRASKTTTPAAPTQEPARPTMAKVTLAGALEKVSELVLAELPDSALVREVEDRLKRKTA